MHFSGREIILIYHKVIECKSVGCYNLRQDSLCVSGGIFVINCSEQQTTNPSAAHQKNMFLCLKERKFSAARFLIRPLICIAGKCMQMVCRIAAAQPGQY